MSKDTMKSITSHAELVEFIKETENVLRNKAHETKRLRYIFRRIPLYAATGFTFFIVCLAMAIMEPIGFKVVNPLLKDTIPFVVVFILISLLGSVFFYNETPSSESTEKFDFHFKFLTNSSLLNLLLIGVLVALTSRHPIFFGIIIFSVITFPAMLIERSLGFTRRNERYQLFADRAESLCILFASRDKLGVKFAESHLIELVQFYEELRLSKHNDTISDSHYLLTLVEQLKVPSK